LAGDIFARLYAFFPEPIDIHSYNEDLGKQDGFDDDPERLRSSTAMPCNGWLMKDI